jgi:hypothetical protein
MRSVFTGCALAALSLTLLVGCKSDGANGGSGWSLSSWNPFKSSSETPPYPELPSQYADTGTSGAPTAYTGTGSVVRGEGDGGAPSAYGYAGSGYSSGQSGYESPQTPAPMGNPYAMPQKGPYEATPSYASTGQQQIKATDPSPYADVLSKSGGQYSPYGASSDAYSGSQTPYMAGLDRPGSLPPKSLGDQPFRSYYDSGSTGAAASAPQTQSNPYANAYGVGDTTTGSAGSYSGGATTDYAPGQTGYVPGDTGYRPPGVSPYQTPADPYTIPGGSSGSTAGGSQGYTPYLPGSIQPYTRGGADPLTGQTRAGTDLGVQAAGYDQPPATRRL